MYIFIVVNPVIYKGRSSNLEFGLTNLKVPSYLMWEIDLASLTTVLV